MQNNVVFNNLSVLQYIILLNCVHTYMSALAKNIDYIRLHFNCMPFYKHYFSILQELVSTMNECYEIMNIDSVSVTLVFILIITIFCMVHKLCEIIRKKCTENEGTGMNSILLYNSY
jgi:hypothetical protein